MNAMKKLYMVGVILITASIAGCSLKITKIPAVSTGDVKTTVSVSPQVTPEITWDIVGTWVPSSAMQEFTGEIDSWVVPTVTGSKTITPAQSALSAEVKAIIENRKTQSGDTTKLTEEDISLMEQIIQKIQGIK